MEDLLSKIFDKVAFYESDGIQFGIEYDAQVEELLEPLRAMKSESDVEEIKELVYAASYHAEKYGFMLGVRFMAKIGGSFYILPSSVHETLFIPCSDDMDIEYLRDMVRTVNATEVSEEEYLSDNVYRYDADIDSFEIA